MYLGRYQEALQLARESSARSLKVTAKSYWRPNSPPTSATFITGWIKTVRRWTHYESARPVFEAANDQIALAMLALNSANVYSNLDDFRQAELLYQQATSFTDLRTGAGCPSRLNTVSVTCNF
jgi:tetratricopeptide (TPR) repeat protein